MTAENELKIPVQNEIPKVLHYIWLGGKEKPAKVLECIETWNQVCPEYEIKEWNESNLDLETCPYIKEALALKKWAFASDVIRLQILYKEGGIYLDTDVKVFKPFDDVLSKEAFIGYETQIMLCTAIIGAKAGNVWVKNQLDYFENRHYEIKEVVNNVSSLVQTEKFFNVRLRDNKFHDFRSLVIYPKDWFNPIDFFTQKVELTENSHSAHLCLGSWQNGLQKFAVKFARTCFVGLRNWFEKTYQLEKFKQLERQSAKLEREKQPFGQSRWKKCG